MFYLKQCGGNLDYNLKIYYAKDELDLGNINTNTCCPGSQAYTADGKLYTMNGNKEWIETEVSSSGGGSKATVDYSLLSQSNITVVFSDNPIKFLTNMNDLITKKSNTTSSITGHYRGAGQPDSAIANFYHMATNEVARRKNSDGTMTYYSYFSDETLPFATGLVDVSAYTTAGYYTVDYNTKSIIKKVGNSLTLNFDYEMNLIRAMYKVENDTIQWVDVSSANEEEWTKNFKDLIKEIKPYEETVEVTELKNKILALEAEINTANELIDVLNGEEN